MWPGSPCRLSEHPQALSSQRAACGRPGDSLREASPSLHRTWRPREAPGVARAPSRHCAGVPWGLPRADTCPHLGSSKPHTPEVDSTSCLPPWARPSLWGSLIPEPGSPATWNRPGWEEPGPVASEASPFASGPWRSG